MEAPTVAGKSEDVPELSQLTALKESPVKSKQKDSAETTSDSPSKETSDEPTTPKGKDTKLLSPEVKATKPKQGIFKKLSLPSLTKGSRPKMKVTPKRKDLKATNGEKLPPEPKENVKPGFGPLVIDDGSPETPDSMTQPNIKKKDTAASKTEKPKKAPAGGKSPAKESSPKSPLKTTCKQENGYEDIKMKPFSFGWKREVVYRAVTDVTEGKKRPADIYYFSPGGQKLRSMPEIIHFLRDHPDNDLGPENFTFLKDPIYHEPEETVRQAKSRPKSLGNGSTPGTPKPPKKKASPKLIDSASPLSVVVPMLNSGDANTSPINDLMKREKRGRKIKVLPPDFVCPDEATNYYRRKMILAAAATKEIAPVPPATEGVALTLAPPLQTKTVAKQNTKTPVIRRAQKRKIIAKDSNDTSLGAPPAKQPHIPLLLEVKKEILSGSDNETGGSSDVILSPQSKEAEVSSRPKVLFTFSKLSGAATPTGDNTGNTMTNGQNGRGQVIPFKKRRITNSEPIKVSQNDRMCSLSCPGRACHLPTLHCNICLCLFHPECVGFLNGPPSEEFKCQRCLYQPYLKSSEPVRKATVAETEIEEPEDPAIIAEETELNNIASSDDDEMFMTVAPEVVMTPSGIPSPEKSPSNIYKVMMPVKGGNHIAENGMCSGNSLPHLGSVLPLSTTISVSRSPVVKPALDKAGVLPSVTIAPTLAPPAATGPLLKQQANQGQPGNDAKLPPVPILPSVLANKQQMPTPGPSEIPEGVNFVTSAPNTTPTGNFIAGPMIGNFPVISSSTVPTPGVPIMTGPMIPGIMLGTPQFRLPLPMEPSVTTGLKPSIPVSMLPNAAPIVVGSQILTPVSINLSGIAKGTLIYTNNPTLRFLLPSTGGLASFGVQPGIASPPKMSTTTTTVTSTGPVPQASVPTPSPFLPIKPPIQVINVKESSLCDIILKLPINDGHRFSTKVVLTNKEIPKPAEKPDEPPVEPDSAAPGTSKDSSSKDETTGTSKESSSETDGISKEISSENVAASSEMDTSKTKEGEPVVLGESKGDVDEKTLENKTSDIGGTSQIDDKTVSEAGGDSELPSVSISSELDKIVDSGPKASEVKPTEDAQSKITDSSEGGTNESNVQTSEEVPASDAESIDDREKDGSGDISDKDEEVVPMEVEEPPVIDEFADLHGPILSPRHPVFEDDEIFSPVNILSDIAAFSDSEDEELDEYRPTTPVVLSRVKFDGSERIVTRRLSNKGAKLTCAESCARISEFVHSSKEFGRNEEHAYHLSDSTEPQRGKSLTTLKIERKPYHVLHSASESLNLVFEYLTIPDLLRAGQVCKTWKKLASQQYLWSTVKLKGIQIIDWKMCVTTLDLNNTALLDLRGVVQDPGMWHNFLATAHHLRKVQGVVFGEVPTWVITSVVNCLPELRCLEAEDIVNESQTLVKMDPGVLSRLQEINILRIRGPNGMEIPQFEIYGGLKMLGTLSNLTHLSLTSLRKLSNDDVRFLEKLVHLQVLEIGQCREWTEQAYHSLGKLRAVRRLRLEMGNQMADRGLANALIQMPRLQELTLLAYRITTSMAASIRRLRHLWHLTIWPDMSTEGAMVVYNTLQAVRSLKRLQSFSWGIIYQDDDKTRYSKKQGKGKYKEASDVDEWWSEDLRNTQRAKGIKIPMLKAFSESSGEQATKDEETKSVPGMEQGLIGVGHLRHKLQKLLPDSEIYVYQVPESLLNGVYGTTR